MFITIKRIEIITISTKLDLHHQIISKLILPKTPKSYRVLKVDIGNGILREGKLIYHNMFSHEIQS